MLKSEQLYYLYYVSQTKSMTIAAEQMHVTQPALSIGIKNLESELNLKLIERTRNGVSLTQDGEKVVEVASEIIFMHKKIENYALSRQYDVPVNLSILSQQSLHPGIVSYLMRNYYQLFPNGHLATNISDIINPEVVFEDDTQTFILDCIPETQKFEQPINQIVLDISPLYLQFNSDLDYVPKDKHYITIQEVLPIPLVATNISGNPHLLQTALFQRLAKYGTPLISFEATSVFAMNTAIQQGLGAGISLAFNRYPSHRSEMQRLVGIKKFPKYCLSLLYHDEIAEEKLMLIKKLLNV